MKNNNQLQSSLHQAETLVTPGSIYYHYKHPDRHYKVLSLAFLESSEEICVVYQALYEPGFTWIRPLNNFLEQVSVNGEMRARFMKIDSE